MAEQHYSREDALEVRAFMQLFLGALKIEDKDQRIRTVMIVLLAGRLALRASEIQHLHEGWIDWERGEIRVPGHEPCFCKWCLNSARGKVANKRDVPKKEVARSDPDVVEYTYKRQYEPKPNASARVVPFGWSKRITAYLMVFFEENEHLDVTQEQMRNDVRKAARNAEGVDPANLTPHPLRATGATFFADAGLLAKPLRDLLGHSGRAQARRYVRASGRQLSHTLYKLMGREEWAPEIIPEDPENRFPVVRDPRPFASETDVDPREYGPGARHERAITLADEEERLYNPRRERRPDDIDYDPSRHTIPGHIDPDGPGFQDMDVKRDPRQTDLEDIVEGLNSQAELEQGERRIGLSDLDDSARVRVEHVAKAAYSAALVQVAWILSFGPVA